MLVGWQGQAGIAPHCPVGQAFLRTWEAGRHSPTHHPKGTCFIFTFPCFLFTPFHSFPFAQLPSSHTFPHPHPCCLLWMVGRQTGTYLPLGFMGPPPCIAGWADWSFHSLPTLPTCLPFSPCDFPAFLPTTVPSSPCLPSHLEVGWFDYAAACSPWW